MDHFNYRRGVYHAEGVSLNHMAKEVGTPFYCYSAATLKHHYDVFAASFGPLDPLICYAVKANGNLAILKILAQCGAGADVVSQGEIMLALAAGIPAEKIVFSGVGKTREEMAFALEKGIFQFNAESESELKALSDIASHMSVEAHIAVRINPDVDAKTHAKISTGGKETKFGIAMDRAHDIYAMAAKLPNVRIQGVSVHIGSQLTTLAPFEQAFQRVRSFVEELRAAGFAITTIDLGGGLGVPYGGTEAPPLPENYGALVQETMLGMDCKLILEPGRLLLGNAGILVSRVIHVKKNGERTFVILDAGMNDLLRPALYGAYHDVLPVQEVTAGNLQPVDVVGPVCETSDIFAEQRPMILPKEGDLMVLRTAGAYGASMASTYNARLLVPEVLASGDEYAIIRPRPTYDDLLNRDRLPDWL